MRPTMLRDVSVPTLLVAAVFAVATFALVDIRQITSLPLPIIDLTIDDGSVRDFDVRTGSVSLEPKAVRIDVPNLNRTIEFPSLALTTSAAPDGVPAEGRAAFEELMPPKPAQ